MLKSKRFKKTGKFILPTVMMIIMLMITMTGVAFGISPAPAENGVDNADGTATVKIPVTKVMEMNSPDSVITNDYVFTLTKADSDPNHQSVIASTQQPDNSHPNVSTDKASVTITKDNINGANYANNLTVDTNPNTQPAAASATVTGRQVKVNDAFEITFDKIGQYKYTCTESLASGQTLQSGVTMDQTEYTVYITVVNRDPNNIDGKVSIGDMTVVKKVGDAMKKTNPADESDTMPTNPDDQTTNDRGGQGVDWNNLIFHNKYETADIIVTETVLGKLGDKNLDWDFLFKIDGDALPTDFHIYRINQGGNEFTEVPTHVKDGDTIKLKHGEQFKITGVPVDSTYSFEETGKPDYSGKIDYTPAQGTKTENIFHTTNNGDNAKLEKTILRTGTEILDYFNQKDELVPTGIYETLMPFGLIALIGLAGGIAVLAVRNNKRKNGTQA